MVFGQGQVNFLHSGYHSEKTGQELLLDMFGYILCCSLCLQFRTNSQIGTPRCSHLFLTSPVWLQGSAAAWITCLVLPCLWREHWVSCAWHKNLSVVGKCAHSSEPSVQQEARATTSCLLPTEKTSWLFLQFLASDLCGLDRRQHVDMVFMFTNLQQFEYPDDFLFSSFIRTFPSSFVLFCLTDALVLMSPVPTLFTQDVKHLQAGSHNLFILNPFRFH